MANGRKARGRSRLTCSAFSFSSFSSLCPLIFAIRRHPPHPLHPLPPHPSLFLQHSPLYLPRPTSSNLCSQFLKVRSGSCVVVTRILSVHNCSYFSRSRSPAITYSCSTLLLQARSISIFPLCSFHFALSTLLFPLFSSPSTFHFLFPRLSLFPRFSLFLFSRLQVMILSTVSLSTSSSDQPGDEVMSLLLSSSLGSSLPDRRRSNGDGDGT